MVEGEVRLRRASECTRADDGHLESSLSLKRAVLVLLLRVRFSPPKSKPIDFSSRNACSSEMRREGERSIEERIAVPSSRQ